MAPRDRSSAALPWPRGNPPIGGPAVNKDAPHWNIGDSQRCAQCGAVGPCGHKDAHNRKINSKWEQASGGNNRPSFFGEAEAWRDQLSENPDLGFGEPLPPGVRRGWDVAEGQDVLVGSPRRHGEWRLIFVPRDKSRDNRAEEMEVKSVKRGRSTNPVGRKHHETRKKWEAENIPVEIDRGALRSVSLTPG
jgi:hypothetical protein